jgi:hypothetical protein
MSTLALLQCKLSNHIIGLSKKNIKEINQSDPDSLEKLGIYSTGYRIRLLDALAEEYPKLFMYLGEDDFYKMATAYIEAYPSDHFSIRYVGRHIADFLKKDPEYVKNIFLSELASFEWALGETLDAADSGVASLAMLQGKNEEDLAKLKFKLHPSYRILSFHYDTPQIWQAMDQESAPRMPVLQTQACTFILWRKNLSAYFSSCTFEQAFILDLIKQGLCFADLCEALAEKIPEDTVPGKIGEWLYFWLNENLFSI